MIEIKCGTRWRACEVLDQLEESPNLMIRTQLRLAETTDIYSVFGTFHRCCRSSVTMLHERVAYTKSMKCNSAMHKNSQHSCKHLMHLSRKQITAILAKLQFTYLFYLETILNTCVLVNSHTRNNY